MAERLLEIRSPLAEILQPGLHGRKSGEAGVKVAELNGAEIVSLALRRGGDAKLRRAVTEAFNLDLPAGPKRVLGRNAAGLEVAVVGVGPGRWQAMTHAAIAGGLAAQLKAVVGDAASVVDLTHAKCGLRLSGPKLREALALLLPIDLHPRAANAADHMATLASHMEVSLTRLEREGEYLLLCAASEAGSLWRALMAAAAQYGCEVAAAPKA